MRFWDASALVPLVVEEAATELCLSWLRQDADVVVWGLTRLELVSAIERRAREGLLAPSQRIQALRKIDRLSAGANEVTDLLAVRNRAQHLLARHALRAADAAQLAAALLVADPEPSSLCMVALDRRLAEAAVREGLEVLTWAE